MKRTNLILNSIFVITISWSLSYFLIFKMNNGDINFSMRDAWIMYLPAVLSGFLVIPINLVNLFLWSKKSEGDQKKILNPINEKINIFLPIFDFFYIVIYIAFFFPALMETTSCAFRDEGRYCYQLFNYDFFSFSFIWLLPFLLLTAMIAKFHIAKFKKDKDYFFGILMVLIFLALIYFAWNWI